MFNISLCFFVSESDGNHSTEDERSKGHEDLSPCPFTGHADGMTSHVPLSSRTPELHPTEGEKSFLFNGTFPPSSSRFLSSTGSPLFGVPGLTPLQPPAYRPESGGAEDGERGSDKEMDRSEAIGPSDRDGVCEKRMDRLDRGGEGMLPISFFRDTETEVKSRASGSGVESDHMEKIQLTGYVLGEEVTADGRNEEMSLMRDSLTLPHLQLPSSSSPAAPAQGESVKKNTMLQSADTGHLP